MGKNRVYCFVCFFFFNFVFNSKAVGEQTTNWQLVLRPSEGSFIIWPSLSLYQKYIGLEVCCDVGMMTDLATSFKSELRIASEEFNYCAELDALQLGLRLEVCCDIGMMTDTVTLFKS